MFDSPGILELPFDTLTFPLVEDAHLYDLTRYHAQIVPNNQPFSFDQTLVSKFKHAQHKLRVVTYNYGNDYVRDYLNNGNGFFIERHDFIQAITPMSEQCGGYVILGTEENGVLELIAATVPFGYTLLVDVGAIHGDSTLTGLYMMAMTGNHEAMATADTVFMKNSLDGCNVKTAVEPTQEVVAGLRGDSFLLTSDEVGNGRVKEKVEAIKGEIKEAMGKMKWFWFQPVVATGNSFVGWTKTLGLTLPDGDE